MGTFDIQKDYGLLAFFEGVSKESKKDDLTIFLSIIIWFNLFC